MDPEDLLDQEVEELPGLEGHATANMDVLKALDTLDVSYRYVIRLFLILSQKKLLRQLRIRHLAPAVLSIGCQ
jgi:hypothetical protein